MYKYFQVYVCITFIMPRGQNKPHHPPRVKDRQHLYLREYTICSGIVKQCFFFNLLSFYNLPQIASCKKLSARCLYTPCICMYLGTSCKYMSLYTNVCIYIYIYIFISYMFFTLIHNTIESSLSDCSHGSSAKARNQTILGFTWKCWENCTEFAIPGIALS